MRIRLDRRSIATILAALRTLQEFNSFGTGELSARIQNIATNEGEFERLDSEEIDALCERLNTE